MVADINVIVTKVNHQPGLGNREKATCFFMACTGGRNKMVRQIKLLYRVDRL